MSPRASSRRTRWLPVNPVPPVTKVRMVCFVIDSLVQNLQKKSLSPPPSCAPPTLIDMTVLPLGKSTAPPA